MTGYGWGKDGYGRAFIDRNDDPGNRVILCMLPGNSGIIGVYMLEDQDEEDLNSRPESEQQIKLF